MDRSSQDAVTSLVEELGLETHPTFADGEDILFYDGQAVRYSDETFGLPEESAEELSRVWERIERRADRISVESPWASPEADSLDELLDELTVATWLRTETSAV